MKVLAGCEKSAVVRRAFAARGWDAWSCDIEPSEIGGNHHDYGSHLECDIRTIPDRVWLTIDLFIVHPECRYLSSSGLHWNNKVPGRAEKTDEALAFVKWLLARPVKAIALENPIGRISTAIRRYDQLIQPYQFGENASKATCLWLQNLPPLYPTNRVQGRKVVYQGRLVERWANQTDSGQNRLGPSATRSADRARTYQGIADAMAAQWGAL